MKRQSGRKGQLIAWLTGIAVFVYLCLQPDMFGEIWFPTMLFLGFVSLVIGTLVGNIFGYPPDSD